MCVSVSHIILVPPDGQFKYIVPGLGLYNCKVRTRFRGSATLGALLCTVVGVS